MINIELLQELLVIATVVSVITVAFIQKTKGMFKKSKWINIYSFIVNVVLGALFCLSFTEIAFPLCFWVGAFSFVEADTLYKSLEGKILSFKDITAKKEEVIEIPRGE